MNCEVKKSIHPDEWIVEAIDDDEGQIYMATFTGPLAEQRAQEYADWKN